MTTTSAFQDDTSKSCIKTIFDEASCKTAEDAMHRAQKMGLGEPRVLSGSTVATSVGQGSRLRIACDMSSKCALDNFGSTVDLATLRAMAAGVRRLVKANKYKTVVVATSQPKAVSYMGPDAVAVLRRGGSSTLYRFNTPLPSHLVELGPIPSSTTSTKFPQVQSAGERRFIVPPELEIISVQRPSLFTMREPPRVLKSNVVVDPVGQD